MTFVKRSQSRAKGNSLMPGATAKPRPGPSHLRAVKQEGETATRLGGRLTPGSGARDEKGDVRIKGLARIECKTTKNASFSVTRETLAKIADAACGAGEIPVLLVEFNDGKGKRLQEVAVIPSYCLDDFVKRSAHE